MKLWRLNNGHVLWRRAKLGKDRIIGKLNIIKCKSESPTHQIGAFGVQMPKKPTPTLPPDEASLPVVTQLPPHHGHPIHQLVRPIRSRHFLNLGAGRAFVSASAAWSSVDTNTGVNFCCSTTASRSQKNLMSRCFILP